MAHQVPAYYSSVSEQLSNILDNVGYSREDRDRKVRFATETEVFQNIALNFEGKMRLYMFGSRGEGSTGPELQSDIDYLYGYDAWKIVTDLSQCQTEIPNFLMVKDNHTHPGYVKLQHIHISSDVTPITSYEQERDPGISEIDSLNRAVLPNTMIHIYKYGPVSGPAWHGHSHMKEFSVDIVFAYRCSQWPREGYQYFQRRRLNGWPTPIQIENARDYGCFVTPVGHPHSSECHLEWRLSFSIAERNLARSFEDTVMKVYILLKMIRKTYIEPVVGDAFSSYHCKVCMFWMRETTPHELWNTTNLLYCLVLCIRQLYEWATTGFCPDYFIVTNNIYDRKIFGNVRADLVQILGDLLSADCTFLLRIKCCNLGQHMTNGISRFDHFPEQSVNEESVNHSLIIDAACECRLAILKDIPQQYSALVVYLDRICYACKYLPYIMQYPLKHVMMVLWSQLGFHIVTICREKQHLLSGENVDHLLALASRCLSFGVNSDATSVRLKLCGLGIELGNHGLTEVCLEQISNYRMRYMYSATVDMNHYMVVLRCNLEFCTEKTVTKIFNTEEVLQNETSFSVVYLPSEMSITPRPLKMEMFRSIGAPLELRDEVEYLWFDWGVVDSLMCLYFFQYLNFSRQRKERQKRVAMCNMIHVIRTEPGILHRDTAFNLLGYSFMQENQLTNAFWCFTQSLKIRPYHNAAKLYLGILFMIVYAKHRRSTYYGRRTCDISS